VWEEEETGASERERALSLSLPFWNFRRLSHIPSLTTPPLILPTHYYSYYYLVYCQSRVPCTRTASSPVKSSHCVAPPFTSHQHHTLLLRKLPLTTPALLMWFDTAMNQTPIHNTEII
jgi:hypothetical protein